MREIKFRAWDDESNLMIYSDFRNAKLYDAYYAFETDSKGKLKCSWETEWTESCSPDGGELKNLMQYTELKDTNKKEIYEGDIVKSYIYNYERTGGNLDDIEIIGTITYEDCAWFIEVNKDEEYELFEMYINDDELEVIGNIYANPELLEVV